MGMAEQMQRNDTMESRNSADSLLADAGIARSPEAGIHLGTIAIAHALLALRGELERIGDILDERMPTL